MKKKKAITIGVVMIIVTITSLFVFIYNNPKKEENIISKLTNTIKETIDCPMDIKMQYTMITDINSDIAKTSRNILLESGITEGYLDTHFSFICGVEYSEENHRVAWKYKINDFETDIIGIINAPENVGPKFQKVVKVLHDIDINISKNIAEQKIASCLNEKPESYDIRLVSGPKDFPNDYNKPEVNQKNENGGLFMTGSTKTQDLNDSDLYHTKSGYLNLETEKCTVLERSFYVD